MSVGVMTVGVMSVGEIPVGVMTVGVMRRPQCIEGKKQQGQFSNPFWGNIF